MKTSTLINYGYQKRAALMAFLVTMLILCSPIRMFSQETIVYSEGFEANNGGYFKIIEPPDPEFPNLTGDGLWEWGVPSWISAHSGSKCWGTNFADNMPQGTSSILSPPISLATLNPVTQTARVSFWAQTDISMSGARGSFLVSSDGSNFTRVANFFIEMAGGWNRYEFDISNYIGGNIYLKFFIVDEGYDRGFYVDDISIAAFEYTSHKRTLTLEANESSEGSCPWIYTWDGSKYVANNDIYSTARYAGSEYRDYLALAKPLIAENGKYKLQIKEVASDESFTDYLQLNVIDHASNVKVAPDNFGNIFAYTPSHLISPVSAVSNKGLDVLESLKKDDRIGFNAYSQDYVDIDFGNVDISSGGRMVLKMQGFLKGTGTPMPYVGPPAVVVQSFINGAWKEVGRMFPRFDWDVCAFDASSFGITPGASVKIRIFSISHDRKYSNIDYVGLETGPEPAKTVSIAPFNNATFSNQSVLDKLNTANNQYANLKPGNHMNLEFNVPPQAAAKRSFIFISEGYYIPRGSTYFVATWSGDKWIIHDGYSFSTIDETKTFDLSLYLPDPDNEMKVRIWQDYAEGDSYPAFIDFVGMQQDATIGTLAEATDLVNFVSIIPETEASDDYRFDLGNQVYERDRWTEYKWSGITNNGLPVISDLGVNTVNGILSWNYADPESDPPLKTNIQVWTDPEGTGSLYWAPSTFNGNVTSALYTGTPLINGVTYHLRIKTIDSNSGKSDDGNNWSQWVENSFVYDQLSVPGVYTTTPTAITTSGATSGGDIFNDGGESVTVSGVCWSTTSNPTISDAHTTDGNAIGTFTSDITGLSGALGVTYYVRAYATNSIGTGYGPELSFTYGLPTVITNTPTNITATDANSGGNVISDGNDPVSVRGVCWNTAGTPTTADDYTEDGSGFGEFTSYITGLTGGTVYYVKAYATNSYGTSYGGQITFGFFPNSLVVNAGDDATINGGEDYSLSGSATGSLLYPVTSFEWTTGGDGTFAPDATSTYAPTYTPGSTDISNGYVYLTLIANCADPVTPTLSDEMYLEINSAGQTIQIYEGWSAISSYLNPQNAYLPDMMYPLTWNSNLIIQLSEYGFFWPEYSVNTLGDWNVEKGYKIKANFDQDFTVYGPPLAYRSIDLSAGLHIIPVLTDVSCPIETIFANPATDILFMFDIRTSALYWPGGEINTLGSLEPGKGYIAKFNNPVTITYPDYVNTKAGQITNFTRPQQNRPWSLTQTADAHFVSINTQAVKGLQSSSFIGAFDSFGTCIGFTEINGKSGNYLLTLYSDDVTTVAKDGAVEAELVSFRAFNSATNQESELIAEFDASFPNSDGLFATFGQSKITGFKESATGISQATNTGNLQIYPNPASDKVTIVYNNNGAPVTISLITTDGKTVKTLNMSGAQVELDVQNLQPGVYVLKMESDDSVVIKRLVIQ